jgi:hypothetical protein
MLNPREALSGGAIALALTGLLARGVARLISRWTRRLSGGATALVVVAVEATAFENNRWRREELFDLTGATLALGDRRIREGLPHFENMPALLTLVIKYRHRKPPPGLIGGNYTPFTG